jgi:hypothetical protein
MKETLYGKLYFAAFLIYIAQLESGSTIKWRVNVTYGFSLQT